MTLDEAVTAVEATFDSRHLLVDRRLAREDETSFLLLVLDISNGRYDGDGRIANGPRLVDRSTGQVVRLTVPEAIARAGQMAIVPTASGGA